MRVIAGKFRSRPLRSLRGWDIRPTADRLRESLFNVLTAGNPEALTGSTWLDLFAGTGAVGIEAMSRGAAMVHFVESSREAVELIAANLGSLGQKTGFEILRQEVSRALPVLERRQVRPDFIFLDPPYKLQSAYAQTLHWLGKSDGAGRGLVIVEHEKKFDPGEEFGVLRRVRVVRHGDAALSFYRRDAESTTKDTKVHEGKQLNQVRPSTINNCDPSRATDAELHQQFVGPAQDKMLR